MCANQGVFLDFASQTVAEELLQETDKAVTRLADFMQKLQP